MKLKDDVNREDLEPVMISALEHYSYCPRQCALIHLEQIFDENIYTLRGNIAHERVDQATSRNEDDIQVERGLPLWSHRLGLTGRADVVEFPGNVPYPVEYKQGKRRDWEYEAIQLCAQALCLEEMLGIAVPQGAIYYCSSRVRREITFDTPLREMVTKMTGAVRILLKSSYMPSAVNDQRCNKCSLIESCLPNVVVQSDRWKFYRSHLFTVEEESITGE
ncbi:CRISPR-associated protein Cas4 [Dictyobacter aurantiacus]|uniref:CRISPR-associated exonuclease Cas4 n=1 Tax=Dictyobacter aurantiacus TaxID=1936993 RepID=A0A401ZH20_9CHLR|nr:CRISPR-associated protein Cas4 [Dictyobacter aurantiacus]GCE06142.1 CRISPR-associated protein Cas4 [Dictyobacter aurantiacus]